VYNEEEQECESFATDKDWIEDTTFAKEFLNSFGRSPHGLKGAGFTVKLGETYWGQNTILNYEPDPSFVVPEWAREWMDSWQSNCELKQKYIAGRMENDPKFRTANAIRRATWESLILLKDHAEILGCDSQDLRWHIEKQFKAEMSWKNYATEFEIDHIQPLSRFDLTNPEEVKKAAHYTNLQPLWIHENRKAYNQPKALKEEKLA
jgi:hypothetical protein